MEVKQTIGFKKPSDLLINQTQINQAKTDKQLASGKRINSAADDAAGLQISNQLTSKINEQEAYAQIYQNKIASNNIESARLQSDTELIQQNQVLTVQSGNGIYNSDDIAALQAQFDANTAGMSDAAGYGVDSLTLSDPAVAADALAAAQQSSDAAQAQLGASSNIAESSYRSSQIAMESQSAARSRILDTNYAQASSDMTKNEIQMQSSMQAYQKQLASQYTKML